MKNMKMSAKLLFGFLLVTVFSVILASVGIWANLTINGDYTYLLDEPVVRQRYLMDMQLQFTMIRYRAANSVMEVENPDIITNTLTPQLQTAYSSFMGLLDDYIKSNESDHRRETGIIAQNRDNANKLKDLVDRYKQVVDKTFELSLTGDAEAATVNLRNSISVSNDVNALLGEMLTPASEFVNQSSESMDQTAIILMIVQIGLTVVCVALSLVLAFYISGLISKPSVLMKNVLYKMGKQGVVHLTEEENRQAAKFAESKDEMGESISMLIETERRLENIGKTLETVASGDLTVEVSLLSENDVMGKALKKMIKNLSNMFGEINASTSQVATGANQIADGSQSLAQGSTEQAAAVEELSSSISEISQKTMENSDMAGKAARLADTIKGNAEKGSEQMDKMMGAVKEINQASHSINKVIKVINDIAFQTNILALNAAVEAARAGEYGKGFAVVAEEVRNLAAKSSEAANDTGRLISNSIEKAELGASIADETAESLTEIVKGIIESNRLVGEIARSSEEQTLMISQINRGIEQVAQVVQRNSATAEQSAAASQEMSGQSNMLEELVSQFKLKEKKWS